MTVTSRDKTGSDTKQLAFLNTEHGKRMVIYERELRTYAKTNMIAKVYAVRTGDPNKPKWELEFKLKGGEENALLVTSLNKPRQFKQLNYMVEFLNDLCPDLSDLVLGLIKHR
ncbi:hypothetical protein [Gilvimarinus chinensis]|uniref:hypothetical protein n=1 Tax=Gilvimarinus chinensis TaxID=396005 RepID=UPI00035C3FAE|nr:hypothetical protein [Gilvimarinus chinensis]